MTPRRQVSNGEGRGKGGGAGSLREVIAGRGSNKTWEDRGR